VIVRALGAFGRPKIPELRQKNQNKENAKDRFAKAAHHTMAAGKADSQPDYRDQSKNLCHKQNSEPSF
jgi:hypothetical protein